MGMLMHIVMGLPYVRNKMHGPVLCDSLVCCMMAEREPGLCFQC